MATFEPMPAKPDFPAMERETLRWWEDQGLLPEYLKRNEGSAQRWSFLDGPITANNPMGVHHAWGRTYKDLFQRYKTMCGFRQRYQNGFDCQGLWVEVEVERELGFRSKRDIETFGIARFVNLCKQRVLRYAAIQSEQSIRLGMWMDWNEPADLRRLAEAFADDPRQQVAIRGRFGPVTGAAEELAARLGNRNLGGSYFTFSDENNYQIWAFLKRCWERGMIYKGHDVMPWCPRCSTGISEHEIVTEGYQELTHPGLFVRFPLLDHPNRSLLVWTTTPWTLTSNVAAAVHPELTYAVVRQQDEELVLAEATLRVLRGRYEVTERIPGRHLVGLRYRGPFDELAPQRGVEHRVIAWEEVSGEEGTGVVHIAPGCGAEDFALSKEHGLPVIAPVDEFGVFTSEFGWLAGMRTNEVADVIIEQLRRAGRLYHVEPYTHRYPVCWRCGSELIFRLVDEWFIAMDPIREELMDITRRIRWIPEFGLDRELDWLRNMHDWMISKKRYWGLALPIFECASCGRFEVVGSREELRERAVAGWEVFDGHTPHRPWVDAVRIRCSGCGQIVSRIPDVGNPWLDAGIVPFSTMGYREDPQEWRRWFPADFVTESFPGQYRNWFYSLLVMSTVLEHREPFRTCLGYALVRDAQGREMHKSWGNMIEFNEAADHAGVDVMRWAYCAQNPSQNLNFGYELLDDVRRRFLIPLWNCCAFFVTYANLEPFDFSELMRLRPPLSMLDRWILSRLQSVVGRVRQRLDDYDPAAATRAVEEFTDDLSNWYVRRCRRRFWKSEDDGDKRAAYHTLYSVLRTLVVLVAPFVPFVAERLYQRLVRPVEADAPRSVHLCDYPAVDPAQQDTEMESRMAAVRSLVTLGRAARARARIRVRQPLPAVLLASRQAALRDQPELLEQIRDELNVKEVRFVDRAADYVVYSVKPRFDVLGPKYGPKVQEIAQALRDLPPERVEELAAGGGVTVQVGTESVALGPDELDVRASEREGFAAAAGGGDVVILDTHLTPELVREGVARELVHHVQQARKEAGLTVDQRIVLYVDASAEVVDAVRVHQDAIAGEVLATRVVVGAARDGFRKRVSVDGVPVEIGILPANV
ncbi:MAG: class I tRNA ligase family protein [Armatimonadota bacterium]|nr:class I tRNA ligase family protein [Armatimonadota bacterium]MDR5696867.1 class I tRNA ligase family protein [Armatimonadota bacterium]